MPPKFLKTTINTHTECNIWDTINRNVERSYKQLAYEKEKRMSLSVMAKRMSSLYRRLPRYCKLLGWACYTQVTSTGKPSVSLDTIQHYIVYRVSTINLVDVVTAKVLYLARITWCRFCTIVTYGHSLVASFRSLKHLNFDWFSRGS